jgi:hypothetical protein
MTRNSVLRTRKRKRSTARPSGTSETVPVLESPPYEPTPFEADALRAYKAAHDRSGPRLRVQAEGKGGPRVVVDHPDVGFGQIAFMKAIGTSNFDFSQGLIWQLTNIGSQGDKLDEGGINFALAVVKGIEPRDQVEAMLAAQMAAVHNAIMTFARRLAHVDTILQQDSAQNAFNKLTRTFAAQVEALKRYRSGGEQKMTVQHVHVAEGGQAIVGNVSTPAPGVGANEKAKDQPHALGYAPGVEMPRQIEAEREAVPVASGQGQ